MEFDDDFLTPGKCYRFEYRCGAGDRVRVFGTFLRARVSQGVLYFWFEVEGLGENLYKWDQLGDLQEVVT